MGHFLTNQFYGVKPGFRSSLRNAVGAVVAGKGTFAGDNLFTINRNLSFLEDAPFYDAWSKHVDTEAEKSLHLAHGRSRMGGTALKREIPGDFVEWACYRGTAARIICDTVKFGATGRKYYLYDLFEHDPSMPHPSMEKHSATLYEDTLARFKDEPNVVVTRGWVPQVLHEVAPETISFLHVDLNNADAEIGALELLFDRVSPGAPIVFDDYGWLAYRSQKLAEDSWLAARGYHMLELPTGQGLLIK